MIQLQSVQLTVNQKREAAIDLIRDTSGGGGGLAGQEDGSKSEGGDLNYFVC